MDTKLYPAPIFSGTFEADFAAFAPKHIANTRKMKSEVEDIVWGLHRAVKQRTVGFCSGVETGESVGRKRMMRVTCRARADLC